GFAVALLILHPWQKTTSPRGPVAVNPPTTQPIAHLALATGAIEVQQPGQSTWQVMPTGADIVPNSKIRTPDKVRCELVMADKSTIRLNYKSEVTIGKGRDFQLATG